MLRVVSFFKKMRKRRKLKYAYNKTWKALNIMLSMNYHTSPDIKREHQKAIHRAIDNLEYLSVDLSNSIKMP